MNTNIIENTLQQELEDLSIENEINSQEIEFQDVISRIRAFNKLKIES